MAPEDYLVNEILALVQGKKLPSAEWRVDHCGVHWINGAGSINWGTLGAAIHYSQDPAYREFLMRVFFPTLRVKLLITEWGTLIYGEMHLSAFVTISHFARQYGHADVLAEVQATLRFILAFTAASQCPDGRILVSGFRSGGNAANKYGRPWYQWALGIARQNGGEIAAGTAMLRAAGTGPKNSWKTAVLTAYSAELVAACPVGPPWTLPSGFSAVCDFVILQCERGVVAFGTENRNSNTFPEILSAWEGGQIACLPGIPEVRHGYIECALREDGDSIAWTIGPQSGRLPLPGKVISRLVLPKFGGSTVPPDHPPVDPPRDPPPTAGPDIEALVAEVIALGAQSDQTEPAVALVRAQKWTEASAAVFAFGVRHKQQGARIALSDKLAKLAEGGR
jgi:hypothetical protein